MRWWTRQQLAASDPATRQQMIESLAAEGGKEALEQLAPLAHDTDEQVAIAAVRGLGTLGTGSCLLPIAGALSHVVPAVRAEAARALSLLGTTEAVGPLLGALRDGAASVRWQAAESLRKLAWQPASEVEKAWMLVARGQFGDAAQLGGAAVDALLTAFQDTQCPSRRNLASWLGRLGDSRAVPVLIEALQDADETVRAAGAEALAKLFDPRAAEALTQVLHDSCAAVRMAALEALVSLAGNEAVPAALGALHDQHWEVRRAAVEALARLRDPQAAEALAHQVIDQDREVREASIRALALLGDARAVRNLVLVLADPEADLRQAALGTLGKVDPHWETSEAAQQAVPGLRKALASRDYWVRQAAADALRQINALHRPTASAPPSSAAAAMRRQTAVNALLSALGDWDRDLRQAAAEALGRVADPRAQMPLKLALQDVDPWVQRAAAQSLRALALAAPGLPGGAAAAFSGSPA